jgi:isoquinoline 1-oxidoreductase alpha subunit
MLELEVNGTRHELEVDPQTPLLWVIREQLGLTGAKYACGIALCGACTVHVEGVAVRSCTVPAGAANGKRVTTIEGLAGPDGLHPVQQAWIDLDVPQCGYCQTGIIMEVAALLQKHPQPADEEFDRTVTNLCRCGTYQEVRAAIHALREAAVRGDANA